MKFAIYKHKTYTHKVNVEVKSRNMYTIGQCPYNFFLLHSNGFILVSGLLIMSIHTNIDSK